MPKAVIVRPDTALVVFDGWISQLFEFDSLTKTPFSKWCCSVYSRRGRLPDLMWELSVKPHILSLFRQRGDLHSLNAGWRCQADVEKAILEFVEHSLEKTAAESTARRYAREFRDDWLKTTLPR
jgi:hypothetical protein